MVAASNPSIMGASISDHSAVTGGAHKLVPIGRAWDRRSTSDLVFEELRSAIRDLRLLPGQAVSESDLARRLQVSRTPVRAAIGQLASAGLVDVIPQVGTVVSLIRMRAVEDARFMRENLEAAAFRTAIARLRSNDRESLEALERMHEELGRQERAHERNDLHAFFEADEALHAQVFAASGYGGLWIHVQRSKLHLDRIRQLTLPDQSTVAELIVGHSAIVDALHRRSLREGEGQIRSHARLAIEKAAQLRRVHPEYFAD